MVVDKDQAPRWQPETLAEIEPAAIDAYFAPLGPDELKLEPELGAGNGRRGLHGAASGEGGGKATTRWRRASSGSCGCSRSSGSQRVCWPGPSSSGRRPVAAALRGALLTYQAIIVYFAVIDLVAAVGLWLTSTWGGVLWLLATLSQLLLSFFFPRIIPLTPWLVALYIGLIALYFLVTWAAESEAE